MRRSILVLCVVACGFGCMGALPGIVSASPLLTYPTGTALPVKALLKATNMGNIRIADGSGSVLYECTNSMLTGELTKNSGSEVEATISTADFGGTAGGGSACTSAFGTPSTTTGPPTITGGTPWCLRATSKMAADAFEIRGGACSEASRSIRYVLDGAGCAYRRTEPLKGTLTTDTGASSDAVLSLVEQSFTRESGAGLLCPAEYRWNINYTLETDKSTAEPLYLS